MTEQPKFQRRKRRGSGPADEVTPRVPNKPADPTLEELEALIAEKEALLQRKAEIEAQRRREAAQEAERRRAAEEAAEQARLAQAAKEKAARDAALEEKRQRRQAELDAQRKRAAAEAEAARAAQRPPASPLVLANASNTQPDPSPVFGRVAV